MESLTDTLFRINPQNKKTEENNNIQECSIDTLPDKKEYELPCPCAGIKCPCGCGNKYGGVCQRPQPCLLCEEDLKRSI